MSPDLCLFVSPLHNIFYFGLTDFTYTVVFCKYPCATLQLIFLNIQDRYKLQLKYGNIVA